MIFLRQFILVIALLFAQLAAGVHAIGHELGRDGALPTDACELCLAAHNLGSSLPGVAAMPPVVQVVLVPDALVSVGRGQLPPPCATQRGPPTA